MPDDARAVADTLAAWLEPAFGAPVAVVGEPSSVGEGFDADIHFVEFSGSALPAAWAAPLVVRVVPDIDRYEMARQEAALQNWCAERGYPAPRVLHVFGPGDLLDRPVQVMERAPGSMLFEEMLSRPHRIPGLIRALAGLQARLHVLPVEGWDEERPSLLERRLSLVRTVVEKTGHAQLAAAMALIRSWAPRLGAAPEVVCHGDFHPLNVLVAGDRFSVIDWTDAGLGDRHGDVARTALLFRLGAVAASQASERALLTAVGPVLARRYLAAYSRCLPVDPARVALWRPVHLLHGWAQVVALYSGVFDDRGDLDRRRAQVRPQLAEWLARRFATETGRLT